MTEYSEDFTGVEVAYQPEKIEDNLSENVSSMTEKNISENEKKSPSSISLDLGDFPTFSDDNMSIDDMSFDDLPDFSMDDF